MKEIQLTKNYVAQVSDVDYKRAVEAGPWHASISGHSSEGQQQVYAKRDIPCSSGKRTTQFLHRFIKNVTDRRIEVDHKDHNGLNCQRSNLRVATSSQNKANARIRSDNTSGIKGVYQRKDTGKWCAFINTNKKHYSLGSFITKTAATAARNDAAQLLHGEFMCAA